MIVEYIWLDANRQFRSKTRVIPNWDGTLDNLPIWNFDGSSTGQAEGYNSEVYIRPVMMVHDPFRGSANNVLAFCDNWIPSETELLDTPHSTNARNTASKTFFNNKILAEDPWFGFELEFFFKKDGKLLGLETHDMIKKGIKQGDFYCGVGASNVFGRDVAEDTLQNVINSMSFSEDELDKGFSNIQVTGLNFEVAPGQCEFQIFGKGIHAADSYYMFKYILERTAEKHGIDIEYNPKPVEGDWNGSGCHTNYSTDSMRKKDPSSYQVILDSIEKLKKKHDLHIQNYGEGNKNRLTGKHETASWKNFSFGVADRGSSIRIPRQTFQQKYGYIEDRRPASSCDPYIVSSLIASTTIL